MKRQEGGNAESAKPDPGSRPGSTWGSALGSTLGGWAGWLMAGLRSSRRPQPQLRLLERIAIAPRQSLALVEAEGRRFLVATSGDGAPAFYPLDEPERGAGSRRASNRMRSPAPRSSPAESPSAARVSW
jgi:hypothetical protein